MKLVRGLIWLLALALLILGGALAYLPTYLASHKGVLEAAASRALGQPVRIEGDVNLAWSVTPALTLEAIRIGAGEPSQGGIRAQAERVEVQLDLGALLERRIRVAHVLIQGADLDLDIGPDGLPFSARTHGDEAAPSVEIDSLQVLNSKVQIRPNKGSTQGLGIARLDLDGLGSPHLTLEGRLEYRDTPVSIRADADPLHEGASLALPFKLRAEVPGAMLDASGRWSGSPPETGLQASVSLKGEDLAALQGLIGSARLPEGPFLITFEVSGSDKGLRLNKIQADIHAAPPLGHVAVTDGEATIGPDSALQLALAGSWRQAPAAVNLDLAGPAGTDDKTPRRLSVTADLGQSRLLGKLGFAFGEQRPRLTGDLSLTKVDLRGLGEPDETTTGESQGQTWMDRPLPFDVLNAFDADLKLSADLVETGRLAIRGPKARLLVNEGTLRLDDLNVPLPGLPLTGQASLDPHSSPPPLDLALDARLVEIPEALTFLPTPPEIRGNVERVSLRAKAKGDTAKALLESLAGELSAATARLQPTRETSGSGTEVRLTNPILSTAPDAPVRLKTGLVLDQQAYDLELEGGTLDALLSQEQPWPRIGIRVRGQSRTDGIDIRGTLGPLHAILTASGLQVDLKGEREGIEVSARGELARLDGLRGSRLDVNASAENLAQIGELVGIKLPDHQPISLAARLEGGDQGIDLSDLEATSGDNNLQGAIKIALRPRIRVDATLDSQVLDLTPYFGPGPTTEGPQTWLDAQPPQALNTIDGSLRLSAGHVHLTDYGLNQAELDATLDSGNLHLLLSAGARRVDVELDLRPQGDAWKLDFKYKGKLDTAWLAETKDTAALSRLPATVDVQLTGIGRTYHDMLGAADGDAWVVLGAGRLDKKANALPFGRILLSLLSALNPLDQGAQLNNIQCAVMQFKVSDGIATSTKGLAVQTPSINAIGSGAINLRTQEIELRFKTTKRKGFGISLLGIADKFLYIKGTLRDPKVAINPTGLLIQGGAAWATSGLSLLVEQLASRLTSTDNPCDTVLHRAQ